MGQGLHPENSIADNPPQVKHPTAPVDGLRVAASQCTLHNVAAIKEPAMYAVIFEVQPKPGHEKDYLTLAQELRADLERMDGFISVERFASLYNEGKLLSLSFWRDEAAIARWRAHAAHRAAQRRGRGEVFADYRIRVASVVRDYGMKERAEAPV
jgi:heme-degrading monooxygenase HmoA